MDSRLAMIGLIPVGALADLLRARGASLVRFNMNVANSNNLISAIDKLGRATNPATRSAFMDKALRLINSGANAAYCSRNRRSYPALHVACAGEDAELVQLLLDNGAHMLLNHACGNSLTGEEAILRTPLMIARCPAIWTTLLEARADPNHYVSLHKQKRVHPLTMAVRDQNLSKVQALLNAGANPHIHGGAALKEAQKENGAAAAAIVACLEQRMGA
jgi:hypothetical protein